MHTHAFCLQVRIHAHSLHIHTYTPDTPVHIDKNATQAHTRVRLPAHTLTHKHMPHDTHAGARPHRLVSGCTRQSPIPCPPWLLPTSHQARSTFTASRGKKGDLEWEQAEKLSPLKS